MKLNMNFFCKFIFLIFYSSPVWCSLNRTKRTTQQLSPTDMNILHHYPDLARLLPILCNPNNKFPFFRRHEEQVVAVNEQVIPQFMYPYDNNDHHHHHHQHHHDQHHGHHDIYYDSQINNPSQFPSRGYDWQVNQPFSNDFGLNQQYINNKHNDKSMSTQVQRPPTKHGDRYVPNSWHYARPGNQHHHHSNEAVGNVDKGINIEVNQGSQNNKPVNNLGGKESRSRQAGHPYDYFNNKPVAYNTWRSAPYTGTQDNGVTGNSLYPRSVSYLDELDYPIDLTYASSDSDPVVSGLYVPTNNLPPPYFIDPRILSAFDEYIQKKIDASHNRLLQNNQNGNVTANPNPNNQTSTS